MDTYMIFILCFVIIGVGIIAGIVIWNKFDNAGGLFLTGIMIFLGALMPFFIWVVKDEENNTDKAYAATVNGYEIYANGTEIEEISNVDLSGYRISIDDINKKVLLTSK